MKKIATVILKLIIICGILSGCGKSNNTTAETSHTASGDVQIKKTKTLI